MGTSVGSFALMLCLTVLSALPVRIVQRTSSPLCTALFNQWLSDMLDNLVILLNIPPLQSFWLQMLSHDPMHRWAEGSTWLRFLMIFLPQSPICLYGFFYHERSPSARALWGRWSPRRSKDRRCHGPEGCPGGRCWKSIARWQLDLELCHHNSSQYHWKLCATHRRHESKASSASEMEKENTWNHEQKKKTKKAARKTSAFCVNRTGGSLTSGAIRDYFRQLGFSDEELVALVGALVSLGHMSKPCEMWRWFWSWSEKLYNALFLASRLFFASIIHHSIFCLHSYINLIIILFLISMQLRLILWWKNH